VTDAKFEGQWYVELHSEERWRGFTVMVLNGAIGEKASPHCTCANARCPSYTNNGVSEVDVNMGPLGCDKFAAGIREYLAILTSAKVGVRVA
jgi:hypothetical protein